MQMSATSLQPRLLKNIKNRTNEKDIAFKLQRPRHLTLLIFNYFFSTKAKTAGKAETAPATIARIAATTQPPPKT